MIAVLMGRRWVILSKWILGLLVVTIVPATAQTVLRTPGERPGPLGDLPAALLTPVAMASERPCRVCMP